jgi:hypothetical protein
MLGKPRGVERDAVNMPLGPLFNSRAEWRAISRKRRGVWKALSRRFDARTGGQS